MRDYRDAKNMAHTLREALAEKQCRITVGDSLELVARLFGVPDWNTLSALIKGSGPAGAPTARKQQSSLEFSPTAEAALVRAVRLGNDQGVSEASVEHLLLSLTEDPDAAAILKACEVETRSIRDLLAQSMNAGRSDKSAGMDVAPSPAFQRVVQRAILDVQASGGGSITGADFLVAIFSEQESTAVKILEEHGMNRARAMEFARKQSG
jgi:hypothetical protein